MNLSYYYKTGIVFAMYQKMRSKGTSWAGTRHKTAGNVASYSEYRRYEYAITLEFVFPNTISCEEIFLYVPGRKVLV